MNLKYIQKLVSYFSEQHESTSWINCLSSSAHNQNKKYI